MKIFIVLLVSLFVLAGCSYIDSSTKSNSFMQNISVKAQKKEPVEEEISSFSTTVYIKDENRQNNITLACQELNGTLVNNGDTFSFCDTLGPAKPEEGYEKADTFDSDGDIFQEYGGGKCQISSTLYNAVLTLPGITIVERHPHSNKVDYVEPGKDAAVAYGSVDFKFKNETGSTIKIYASNTPDSVDIRVVKIS